jgi:acetyltransferase-like isoleucine patch superfamily enzyme
MNIDRTVAANLKRKYGVGFFPKIIDSIAVKNGNALFERYTQHLPGEFMPLGAYSYSQSFFPHVGQIGRYCSIGGHVQVMNNSHPVDWASTSPVFYRHRRAKRCKSDRVTFPPFQDLGAPIEIGNDVWVGDGVLLAHGIKLGTGSVIAARSIVTRDVPPYAIVGGSPARFIRWRFSETIIEKLLESEWWTWAVAAWDEIDPRDISAFLGRAEIVRETLLPMTEVRMTANKLISSMKIQF